MIRGNTLAFGGAGSWDALFAMIAARESDWTATVLHPEGSYLIVDDRLFHATADIFVNTAIRPGENVVQATILEALHNMIQPEQPVIEPLMVTENGIYTIRKGVDGYGPILVGVAVRSPRCDQVVTFDWAEEQKYIAWMDDVPDVRPGPTPPPAPEPELLADIVTTFDWAEEQKYIAWDDGTPEPDPDPGPDPPAPSDITWANSSDTTVAALLDAAAAGTIDLQRDAGWQVGDKRRVHVDAFTGGNNVSFPAQDVDIVISSFEEYNGCGNLLQFDFADGLSVLQRMNASDTTTGGYSATEMYTTTLPALASALPSWMKTRMKNFYVFSKIGGSDYDSHYIETVPDNLLALRAAVEVFGASNPNVVTVGEGVQAAYYQEEANRIKKQGISGAPSNWWTRTVWGSINYKDVGAAAENTVASASTSYAVSPFGCLGGAPGVNPELPRAVSFADGSDAEIAALLDAAHDGIIDLQQYAGWSVGDTRTLHYRGWDVSPTYHTTADSATIVITSFAEYENCGNFLQFDFASFPCGKAPINTQRTTVGGYGAMAIKTYSLPKLAEALPPWLKSRLKTFSVKCLEDGTSSVIESVVNNKLSLRSMYEIFGTGDQEGTPLPYYVDTQSHRAKGGGTWQWWTRTLMGNNSCVKVNADGDGYSSVVVDNTEGVAPFGCL